MVKYSTQMIPETAKHDVMDVALHHQSTTTCYICLHRIHVLCFISSPSGGAYPLALDDNPWPDTAAVPLTVYLLHRIFSCVTISFMLTTVYIL